MKKNYVSKRDTIRYATKGHLVFLFFISLLFQSISVYSKSITYTLTATTSSGGTVNLNPTASTYNSGTDVSITAIPSSGYQFIGWSGSVTSTVNPLTITMNGDKSIMATFAPLQYALTISTTGSGT